LWLIKHWFSASTFVVKIATFAKPETVSGNGKTTPKRARNIKRKFNDNGIFTE
jgi:hypothetical protein